MRKNFWLLFPITFALSVVLEARIFLIPSWQQAYQLHSFVNNLPLWLPKHILIALGLSLLIYKINQVRLSGRQQLTIAGICGVILTIVEHTGYQGPWICEYGCELGSGLLGDLGQLGLTVLLAGCGILIPLHIFKKFTLPLVLLVVLVALPILIFVIWRPWYQDRIVSQVPFEWTKNLRELTNDEQFFQSLKVYADAHQVLRQEKTVEVWEKACDDYQRSTFGVGFYGAAAVTNCYTQGAVLYNEPMLCQSLLPGQYYNQVGRYDCEAALLYLHSRQATMGKEVESIVDYYRRTATKPSITGVTFSSGLGLTVDSAILIASSYGKQSVAEAEAAYIKTNFSEQAIFLVNRHGHSNGIENPRVIDWIKIRTAQYPNEIWLYFDVTQTCKSVQCDVP